MKLVIVCVRCRWLSVLPQFSFENFLTPKIRVRVVFLAHKSKNQTNMTNSPKYQGKSGQSSGRGHSRGRDSVTTPATADVDDVNPSNVNRRAHPGRGKRGGSSRRSNSNDDDRPGSNGNLDMVGRGRKHKSSGKEHHKPKGLTTKSDRVNNGSEQPNQNIKIHNRSVEKQQNGNPNNSNSPKQSNDKSNESINNSSSNKKRKSRTKKVQYPPHHPYSNCLSRYNAADPNIIRGKLRVMPAKNGAAFVTCDRGSLSKDILIINEFDRNRALDGDYVFVELLSNDSEVEEEKKCDGDVTLGNFMERLVLMEDVVEELDVITSEKMDINNGEEYENYVEYEEDEYLIDEDVDLRKKLSTSNTNCSSAHDEPSEMWHDDEIQMNIWDPIVNLRRKRRSSTDALQQDQRKGKVICVVPPKSSAGKSELTPADESYLEKKPCRIIVGTLSKLPDGGNKCLFSPNNKSLPRFMCPAKTLDELKFDENDMQMLFKAEYVHGTWSETNKWPPCTRVTRLCGSCNVEDETKALLVEHDVDHGEFPSAVLRDVEEAVKSGRFVDRTNVNGSEDEMGWKPTEEMLRGRRDYRSHRVFTIDPTTARDLDDALHIMQLPDGRVEIGVHIADVSHFVKPETAVDEEALRRATTVYLVDRVLPMLPRPLCEIACSLNENVERLAFSCVWRMNLDGTMRKGKAKPDDVWYGRTVIKSCARLDYATAQNIIDKKVATGEKELDETLWPKSRQPTGGHTIDEVAADVRLMHKVAMARRKLRFENGALALNGIKLTFQLEDDGETPKMCAPYPIRDSNR